VKKIKVLHLIKTLNLGGAETNLFNLVREIDVNKFELHVGYSFGGVIEERFKQKGIRLFKYAQGSHRVKSLASILIIFRLIRYIKENGIQIVHTHNFNAHIWGAIAAKLSGIKLIEHVHDFRYEEPDYLEERGSESKHYKFIKYFTKFSDVVIVLTQNNKDFLLKHRLCTEDRVRIILNGIPLDRKKDLDVPALQKKLGIPEGKRMILSAARMSPEKNIKIILDIAAQLKEKNMDVFFVIAGEGPSKEKLEESVHLRNLDSVVRFIGFYPDVKELLDITSIFIQPTLLELHSITMLESMSMQVPVLASKGVGCNDDFITDKVNGFLLDPYNAKEWCDTISLLLGDETLMQSISKNGRLLVEDKYDIRKTVKNLENIYFELTGVSY
jgi:glycosyltransferase involved in cell wall biosynthesis